jgi:RNA polymerase sigma factor (sigma-70 family)
MPSEHELLRRYWSEHSEEAFATLVHRYLPLVYGNALRAVNGDSLLAQEIAQDVFLALSRQASTIKPQISLVGWLHKATRYVASKAVRSEVRRRFHEQNASMNAGMVSNADEDLLRAQALLDQSLEALGDDDREVFFLRYCEAKDFRGIAAQTGLSEATVRKRVERALGKLRRVFEKRGLRTSEAALGMMLAGVLVGTVPAGLAASIVQTALSAGGVGITATGMAGFMAISKIEAAFAGLALAGLGGLLLLEKTNEMLRERTVDLTKDNAQLLSQLADANRNRLSDLELAGLRSDHRDAIKLRSDLARLKKTVQSTSRP